MTLTEILLVLVLLLLIVSIVLSFVKRAQPPQTGLQAELQTMARELGKIDPLLRSEFRSNREETQTGAKDTRQELSDSLKTLGGILAGNITDLTAAQKGQLDSFSAQLLSFTKSMEDKVAVAAKESRTELTKALQSFEASFTANVKDFNELQRQKFSDLSQRQEQLRTDTESKLDKIRDTMEKKLQTLQEENAKKLEEMRNTVDEKLQATLEKRFSESFTVISERLEQVHKGLGEMQGLATNVGDLKKIMTNVKSRGVMGEYQLANLLEDLLTNEQYAKNVHTKAGSGAIVEFAIRMPNNNNLEKTLWLPIDSKFPKEDYEALVNAYDDGNPVLLEELRKKFKASIIRCAKDIREKYIDPPNTTEYGIMFLPFESLYAEVLRTSGLFELLQKDYKVTITGPTTLSALLNSLQMGFRTLAIEKRSSEVWDLLGAVKTEFHQFGTILEKTKKKLQEATNTIDKAGVRSRAIERQLRKVQELPAPETLAQIESAITAESVDLQDLIEPGEDGEE
jgi:DNA recombination protein RmuC